MAPETRESLLLSIREAGNHEAWREFVDIYQPVIYRMFRKFGEQDADACDLSQELLLRVSQNIEKWRLSGVRGSFRAWLRTVARNLLVSRLRQLSRRPEHSESPNFWLQDHVEASAPEAAEFEREENRAILRLAALRVEAEVGLSTWQAFKLVNVDGLSNKLAGIRLNMTEGGVRAARCRVLARIREFVKELTQDE